MAFKVQVGPPQIAIHQGQTVLVTDPDGTITWPSEKGLYFLDTRVISNWAIYANGEPWQLLNGGPIDYYAARIFLTNGTGRFNLAQGFVGMLAGVGAVLSTTFFGLIVGNFGSAIGFLSIAAAALITVFIAWLLMPETGLPETKRLNEKSEPLRSA